MCTLQALPGLLDIVKPPGVSFNAAVQKKLTTDCQGHPWIGSQLSENGQPPKLDENLDLQEFGKLGKSG